MQKKSVQSFVHRRQETKNWFERYNLNHLFEFTKMSLPCHCLNKETSIANFFSFVRVFTRLFLTRPLENANHPIRQQKTSRQLNKKRKPVWPINDESQEEPIDIWEGGKPRAERFSRNN